MSSVVSRKGSTRRDDRGIYYGDVQAEERTAASEEELRMRINVQVGDRPLVRNLFNEQLQGLEAPNTPGRHQQENQRIGLANADGNYDLVRNLYDSQLRVTRIGTGHQQQNQGTHQVTKERGQRPMRNRSSEQMEGRDAMDLEEKEHRKDRQEAEKRDEVEGRKGPECLSNRGGLKEHIEGEAQRAEYPATQNVGNRNTESKEASKPSEAYRDTRQERAEKWKALSAEEKKLYTDIFGELSDSDDSIEPMPICWPPSKEEAVPDLANSYGLGSPTEK